MEKFKYLVVEENGDGEVLGMNMEGSDLEIEEFCNKLFKSKVREWEVLNKLIYFKEFSNGVCRMEEDKDYYYGVNVSEDEGYYVYRVG